MHDELTGENSGPSFKKAPIGKQRKTRDSHILKGLVSYSVKKRSLFRNNVCMPVLTLSFQNNFSDDAESSKHTISGHAFQLIFLQFLPLSTMTTH